MKRQNLPLFRTDEYISLTLEEGKFKVLVLDLVGSFSGVDEMFFNNARVILPDGTVYYVPCGATHFSGTNHHDVLRVDLTRLTKMEIKAKPGLSHDEARRLKFAPATLVV